MKYYKFTKIGPRRKNEDAMYVDYIDGTMFACIADGVGGIAHGEIASNYATEKFKENIISDVKLSFSNLLIQTNKELEEIATKKYNVDFIATTFSGLYMNRKKIKGIHIGDSRVILIRDGKIKQLSEDQSEFGRLIREKKFDKKDSLNYHRKNILENVLGNTKYFDFQEFELKSRLKDRLILSTDGFHESISDDIILRISNKYLSLGEVFRTLVNELENRVLTDNASFICLEL